MANGATTPGSSVSVAGRREGVEDAVGVAGRVAPGVGTTCTENVQASNNQAHKDRLAIKIRTRGFIVTRL